MEDQSYCLADGIKDTFKVSHNACSVNRFNVSYWIQIDRGDFPVTDLVGEFSIIDPSFQVETYGSHLHSDMAFVKNYAIRRCFVEFLNYLPSHLEGRRVSFAVLRQDLPLCREGNSVFHCRCFFDVPALPLSIDAGFQPIDFELSLTVENVKANKQTNKKKENK